jgi:hypothetical protein
MTTKLSSTALIAAMAKEGVTLAILPDPASPFGPTPNADPAIVLMGPPHAVDKWRPEAEANELGLVWATLTLLNKAERSLPANGARLRELLPGEAEGNTPCDCGVPL